MRGTMLVHAIKYDGGMRGTMLVRVIRYDGVYERYDVGQCNRVRWWH